MLLVFSGNPSRLRQIRLNLLSYALEFTDQGYSRLGVAHKTVGIGKNQLHLEVEDSGIGLKGQSLWLDIHELSYASKCNPRVSWVI
jgi:C4-dicarboxylate-specific signal transduction histidine kinase